MKLLKTILVTVKKNTFLIVRNVRGKSVLLSPPWDKSYEIILYPE